MNYFAASKSIPFDVFISRIDRNKWTSVGCPSGHCLRGTVFSLFLPPIPQIISPSPALAKKNMLSRNLRQFILNLSTLFHFRHNRFEKMGEGGLYSRKHGSIRPQYCGFQQTIPNCFPVFGSVIFYVPISNGV